MIVITQGNGELTIYDHTIQICHITQSHTPWANSPDGRCGGQEDEDEEEEAEVGCSGEDGRH